MIFAISLVISAALWVVPIHVFVNYLAGTWAVERDARAGAVTLGRGAGHRAPSGLESKWRSRVTPSLDFHERPIVDDHGERRAHFLGNGPGKIEAPAGNESYLDAARDGLRDRAPIGLGNFEFAVEERAVYIDGD